MKTNVIVTLNFEAIHNWPECPFEEVDFLRDPHRHVFYVVGKKAVNHDDRDVEIIMLKRQILRWIKMQFPIKDDCLVMGKQSCEMLARRILEQFELEYCSVLEDNENGAEIYR